jgi:PAS domain S-box-containing protein
VDITKMFENLNAAIVASDADSKIIYQNKKCRELFKDVFNREDYIGADLSECHTPEATAKVKKYFNEYREKTRDLDYYVMDEPDGKITVVNVPVYDGEEFSGIVEFIFDGSLT